MRGTGIVLAGGRSTRFGRDKLAEPIAGRTLLELAIAAVAEVTTEVIVVAAPGGEPVLDHAGGVRVVHDPEAFGGPLVGLLAGLDAAGEPLAMVAGGDMPGLRPEVLALMLELLEATPGSDAVALADGGRVRPLPLAIRVGAGSASAADALSLGARSLHALLDGLRVEPVPEATWRALDPGGETLRDIDRPGDLDGAPR